MNLAIDLGNSFAKAALFEGETLKQNLGKIDAETLRAFVVEQQPENIIVSAVGTDPHSFIEGVPASIPLFIADHTLKLPIINQYASPATLGMDRLAAVVGANFLYPRSNCLVIDTGTCITYDVIDQKGRYHGGSIAPGIQMKFKALHTFTAKLPFVESAGEAPLIGKDTQQSIQSGVVQGTIAEIEGMIKAHSNFFSNIKTIICGGDAKFFETKIKAPIFVTPELVLIGLNRILQYNVSTQ